MGAPLLVLLICDDLAAGRRLESAARQRRDQDHPRSGSPAADRRTGGLAGRTPPDLVLVRAQTLEARLDLLGEAQVRLGSVPVLVIADPLPGEREWLMAAGALGVWPVPRTDQEVGRLARILDRSSDQTPRGRLRILRDPA